MDTAIKTTADKVDAGWKATAGETSIDVKPTEDGVVPTLNFAGDDKNNILVTADTNKKAINVELNSVVTLKGDSEDNEVVLNGDNGTINAKNSNEKTILGFGSKTTNTFDFNNGGKFETTKSDIKFGIPDNPVTHTAEFNEDGATFTKTEGILFKNNSSTNIDGGTITISSDDRKGKDIVIDGATGEMTGLSNTTVDYQGFATEGKAATEEQLNEVYTEASKHTTVDLADENGNLTLEEGQNEAGGTEYKLGLKDNLNVTSVTAGNTTLDNKGLTIAGTTYVSSTGLNAGGKVISNVDNGINPNDAVNVSQLEKVEATANKGWTANAGNKDINVKPGDTLQFKGDNNINVAATTDIFGNNAINVGLKPVVTLDGNKLDGDSIVLNGYDGTINAVNSNVDVNVDTEWDTVLGIPVPSKITTTTTTTSNKFNFDENGGKFVTTEDQIKLSTDISDNSVTKVTHTAAFNEDGATFTKEEGLIKSDVSTTNINGGTITISSDARGKDKVVIDGNQGTITGLSNTTWDGTTDDVSRAATEGQLKDVADMAGSAAEEAGKHTTVKKGDNNLVITSGVNEAGGSEYTISLNDNILLGDMNTSGVMINGTNGTIAVTNGFTVGSTTVNDGKIIGLANVDWSPEQTRTDEDLYDASQGATQGQLDDLYSSVVGYDINEDGTINYNSITLGNGSATEYKGKDGGGVRLTNVAYAGNITDSAGNVVGSAAVNVDYLNDTIKNSASGGEIAENEKHLATNVGETADRAGVTYAPDDTGKVTIEEVNGNGEFTGNSVVISDVASKQELDSVKDNIGDMDFSDTNYIKGDTNLTDAVVDLDDAIKDTNDRIDGLGDKIDEVSNSSITGGKINEDTGKIDLIKNDGTAVTMEGQLSDSILDTVDDSKLKSDGEIILTSHDKYDPNKTESVTLNDIASKTNLDNLSSTVGATTTEELKESYKDTAYINDADTMVDADVKLDQAVQNVASTSYANDMYLNERINNVESRLGDVEERIDKVGAMAAAIANLRTMGYDPEAPTEIAVGVGQYKSETGLALGIFHYPNQDFMLSASLSSSGDELMGGIGATWKLGRKSAAERAKDEEARHLEQAEEMKKLAQQEKVKAQAQRHAKLLEERQHASQEKA